MNFKPFYRDDTGCAACVFGSRYDFRRKIMRATVESDRARRLWDRLAPRYDRGVRLPERLLFAGGREWVCSRARGDVLEVSVGTGRNLPCYSSDVQLTAVDISPAMLDIARQRAAGLGLSADLRVGDAQALPFSDAAFDTVVCTLALCSIPDPAAAVAEMRRVLRPGGRLLLLEHVRSPRILVRTIQRLAEPLMLWLHGDHLLREPLDFLAGERFEVEELERSKFGVVERVAARTPTNA